LNQNLKISLPKSNAELSGEKQPWLKNWPPEVPRHLNIPQVPLQTILSQTAENSPEKTAITCGNQKISYAELDGLSNKFADSLFELGTRKGDRVGLFLPNIPQFLIAFFGALKAGAVVTAVSPLHREREVEHQLSDSGAQTVVVLEALLPIVEKVWEKTHLKKVIVTGLEKFGSNIDITRSNVLDFNGLVEKASGKTPNLQFQPDVDLAALQYTGGTTGTAKGAMLTHSNLASNALAFASWIKGTSQDVFLAALPLFHIYGMTTSMTTPISLGAEIVLLSKFDPLKVLQAIEQNRVTVYCGSPTMYAILLANPELEKHDLTSIRVCISGASPLPPRVQKRFMEVTGGFLAEGYGLTEASPVTHCNPVDKSMKTVKVGSIGLPLPGTDARIVDLETGQKVLAVDEKGELAVKGPQVMLGYWQNAQETATVLRDGWLLTGDVAYMDSDGYFYVTDRKKDLIKHKDYSVYPRELEDVLYEHPAVKLCAVVGKPDVLAGEVPVAFVVLKEGAVVSGEELMAFVNGKVAFYKAIKEVEFRGELPISGAGKVLRRELKRK
jgi:long-chain acyl-CoA synthetase